ncbi:MAG: protein kinase [Blastocatellia bacterium]|nr:protein kinase [Blastocatellia bacterium]
MSDHCILIVDDDIATLKILEKAFQSLDCQILTAQNGQQALNLCLQNTPSLIISDWHMPILNGIDLFFHIKNSSGLQHIPFIFITISEDEEIKKALLTTGIKDYWRKPLNLIEIVAKTKTFLTNLDSNPNLVDDNTMQLVSLTEIQSNDSTTKVPVIFESLNSFPKTPTSNNSIDAPSETFLYIDRILNSRYKLLNPIGRGGMGIVYKAYDLAKNQEIALKLLRREYISNMVEVERFAREASATLRINHPNVVQIYEYGLAESGQAFITMELLPGHSLTAELFQHGFISSQRKAVKIMRQICLGVLAAHRQGVIHRDLKPANIFLLNPMDDAPRIKVLDFGIAFLQSKQENFVVSLQRLTDPNIIVGTPEYMSPEQIQKLSINEKSDIYSLGVVFYELLTGDLPFLGNQMQILIAQVSKTPTHISKMVEINPKLADLIMAMLEKNPEQRPSLESIANKLELYF